MGWHHLLLGVSGQSCWLLTPVLMPVVLGMPIWLAHSLSVTILCKVFFQRWLGTCSPLATVSLA